MFQVKEFLNDHFVKPSHVIKWSKAYELPPLNAQTVEKWNARNSIPGHWLAALLAVLELENGGPVSIAKYVRWGTS